MESGARVSLWDDALYIPHLYLVCIIRSEGDLESGWPMHTLHEIVRVGANARVIFCLHLHDNQRCDWLVEHLSLKKKKN